MKSPTQTIIEDGIKGGYKGIDATISNGEIFTFGERIVEEKLLLDPKFWEAVGVTRGWNGDKDPSFYVGKSYHYNYPVWKKRMHQLIDALAQGLSIDEALKTLE